LAICCLFNPSQSGGVTLGENARKPHKHWLVTDVTDQGQEERRQAMNQAIVDRAIEALAKVGAARSPKRQVDKLIKREDNHPRTASAPVQAQQSSLCGSPYCAGCYEVERGVRIHPPKSGKDWVQ
jgi:hypothetical protein